MTVRLRIPQGEARARAERLFEVASNLGRLAEPSEDPAPPPFARLYAYATDPDLPADPDLERALELNPRLQQDFRRLVEAHALFHLPRLAAASTSEAVASRTFSGGRLRLAPSRAEPDQVYLVIELSDRKLRPKQLFCFGREGRGRFPLPEPREGIVQLLLDRTRAEHAFLIDAVQQVDSELFLT